MSWSQLLKQGSEFGEISLAILNGVWPILAFFLLFWIFKSTWLYWRQAKMKKEIKWIMLEFKIPREIKKSPKAMEQVLTAIHSLRNAPGTLKEWYWDGEVTQWYALEMVSFGGNVRFFMRAKASQRGLIEAAFFSYYPDVEIVEVDDYVDKLPHNIREMRDQGYDLWGTELLLRKPEAYPIKSYKDFEDLDENRQFDPISVFLEVLGKLKKEEIVGIQILIAPTDPNWAEDWEHFLEKLKEPKQSKHSLDDDGSGKMITIRSPGETDVLKAVEENFSKPAFDTLIRFIYLSPKSLFQEGYARRGLMGAFKQYSSLDLNDFMANNPTSTRTQIWSSPYIFPRKRNEYRKQRLLYTYRYRYIPQKTFMGKFITSYLFNWNFATKRFRLNTESLATLFHPPTFVVLTAPHIERVESRKTSPPAGLAIFGDESDITKYQ
jgi:hypothetical protein